MKIGIPKEIEPGERRVAGTPDTVRRLRKQGFEVVVESGAGRAAEASDHAYVEAGAQIAASVAEVWQADLVLKVRAPMMEEDGSGEVALLRPGGKLICLLFPAQNHDLVARIAQQKATIIALDQIPRISRAQKMDVLSSMANIAGYRAVVEAATAYGALFCSQITAAGKSPPAKVLVIGAGVAGLAAVAAARGLGAEVRAFDVRPAVKEQVESLGASFLEVDLPDEGGETAGGYAKQMSAAFIEAEMALFADQARQVDVIITTALIPGKRAPTLITEQMVASMKPGSVVVDLAAEQGGNCAATVPGELVRAHGVSVIGFTDLTSRMSSHASRFFGSNLCHLLDDLGKAEGFHLDLEDEVVRKATVVLDGEIIWPPPPDPKKEEPPAPTSAALAVAAKAPVKKRDSTPIMGAAAAILFAAVGLLAPADFVQHFTVFILACFIGWQVVWSVTPALHTPLMSVTNAISGIIIVGGMLQAVTGGLSVAGILGAIAILVASINIAGGFLVTNRMLQMFRRDDDQQPAAGGHR